MVAKAKKKISKKKKAKKAGKSSPARATKKAAATAVGLTGLFGYASTILSGWGLGYIVQKYGWNMGFAGMLICAALGALMFALSWPAKAHGYEEAVSEKL